jgi:lipoprotein-anchoring transpeptidase ErfK/SrfK
MTSRARSALLSLFVALIPLAPIVAGFVITSGARPAAAAVSARLSPVNAAAPAVPAKAPGSTLPPGRGSLVAILRHPTTMRASAGGRGLARVGTHTDFGSPQALWVLRRTAGWLGVVSPAAGNGRLGWIRESTTELTRVNWELKVSLAARQLTVLEDGKTIQRYTIAVGRPTAPTPTGRFAVTDRLLTHDPAGPYGCCILALSAVAPHAIQGWNGGNRIAIHSTPETSSIGLPVSHGCLRLTLAEGRWLMAHIPLGTPTLIGT